MPEAKRRKADTWTGKIQIGSYVAIVTLALAVLGLYGSGVQWVSATDKSIESCDDQGVRNKQHILILEANATEVKEALIRNTGTLNNIAHSVEKMEVNQMKSMDKMEQTQDKIMELVIEILKNGHENSD